MAEEKKEKMGFDLNITVIALVAVVAIVSLTAIVLKVPTGNADVTVGTERATLDADQLAAEVQPMNAVGSAMGRKSCQEYRNIADSGIDSEGLQYGNQAMISAGRLAAWGGC